MSTDTAVFPLARALQQVSSLRRSGWTVNVWATDLKRGVLLIDGLEPGGTFAQGYGFRGEVDRNGNLTAEPVPPEDDTNGVAA